MTQQRYDRVAAERSREQQAMLGYTGTEGCRMEYLRRELDDPEAAPCGRCDNCTGVARAAGVSSGTEEFARDRLRRPGVTVTPRRHLAHRDGRARRRRHRPDPGRGGSRAGSVRRAADRHRLGRHAAQGPRRRRAGRACARRAFRRRAEGARRVGLGRAPGRGGDPAVPVPAPPDHRARPADRGGRKAQLPGQPGVPQRRTAGAPVQQRPATGRAVAHPCRAR